MKKGTKKYSRLLILGAFGVFLCLFFAWCSTRNVTDKDRIISIYRRHESDFAKAAATDDYSSVEKIWGVTGVDKNHGTLEFSFGGKGLVPNSTYYGVFYIPGTADADYAQVFGSDSHWSLDGDGYRYIQGGDGDNEFYYESLGNGFYYFEEHY